MFRKNLHCILGLYNLECILIAESQVCCSSHVLFYDVGIMNLCLIAESFDVCK